MKKLIAISLLISLASCQNYQDLVNKYSSYFSAQSENKNSKFIDGMDIPLFPDFRPMQDEMNFDSSSGSISSFRYRSNSEIPLITDFYVKNMPQLGWVLSKMTKDKMIFIRSKENLTISLDQISKSGVEIKFFLSSVF